MAKLNVVVPATDVEVNGKKYRKVDRDAQAGDIVRITDEGAPDYVVEGGFYEVVHVDSAGDAQIIDEDGDELDLCWYSFDVYEEVAESPTPKYREEQRPLYKEVKRHAKVGERIKIVNAFDTGGNYENGSILTVTNADRWGNGRAIDVEEVDIGIYHREYVVLEPIADAAPERLKVGDYAKVVQQGHGNYGKVVKVTKNDRSSEYIYSTEKLDGTSADIHMINQLVRATDEEVAAEKVALDPRNKFAKGDKVRLVSGGGEHPLLGFENGEIYTVSNPKTLLHSDKRIEIVGGHINHGYAKPEQLEKVSAEELAEIERKQAEEARWAAIGRKVNEFKRGDIVKGTGIHSKKIEIGTVQYLSTTLLGVRTEPDGYSAMDVAEVTLIAPVEQRFDRTEAA